VRRYPCGLAVNILAYRMQTQCFWREILKQLMHSMGMSLIRDKAVNNFLERIQRISHGKPANFIAQGWLELRKGFHTYLSSEGDLLIFQDSVLRKNLIVYNPATTKNQSKQSKEKNNDSKKPMKSLIEGQTSKEEAFTRLFGVTINPSSAESATVDYRIDYSRDQLLSQIQQEFPDYYEQQQQQSQQSISNNQLIYGPWKIDFHVHSSSTSSTLDLPISGKSKKLFRTIEDVLVGQFTYDIVVPIQVEPIRLALLQDIFITLEQTFPDMLISDFLRDENSCLSKALSSLSVDLRSIVDVRCRDGLPLFIPWSLDALINHEISMDSSSNHFHQDVEETVTATFVTLQYSYVGRRADQQSDHTQIVSDV
jgi:hypothetical protein